MKTRQVSSSWLPALIACAALTLLSGCNTLSSLGLPFGGSNNEIVSPAKSIAERPGQSLLQPKELAMEPMPVYFVEVGDTILLEPVKFDATIRLPGDQVVKPDGFISLGEFGQLYASNKTIEQIREEAQQQINEHLRQDLQRALEIEQSERLKLEQGRDLASDSRTEDLPMQSSGEQEDLIALQRQTDDAILKNEVSARLVNWESKRIYVLGEVNSPGSFVFTGHQTTLDALIEAGGMTSRANRHEIIVSRPTSCSSSRVVMKICYDQIVQLGDASTNYQLQPGDRVFVPSLTFCDDIKQTFSCGKYKHCPRCADCPRPTDLPEGCE